MKNITVASVQFNHKPGDKKANWQIMEAFIEEAAAERVEMVVFPEMCITGYWHVRNLDKPAIDALAEPVPDGPSTRRLRQTGERLWHDDRGRIDRGKT